MRVFHSQAVKDEAQAGAARRAVHRFAAALGFGEDALAELAIVVQEMATNAARYATGGGCLHWAQALGPDPGVELFYADKGPGIHDVERALADGVSSGGSLGTGFGAMRRLLDEFDVYSSVKGTTRRLSNPRRTTHGTALLGRKWLARPKGHDDDDDGRAGRELSRRLGAWSRPRPGDDANGDAYLVREHAGETLLAVVDGLGHGRGAREAAVAALETLGHWEGEPLEDLFDGVHGALRATRGAVMAALVVSPAHGRFDYCGVGNVEVRVFNSPEPARPIPSNGTLGARMSQVRVWPHRWAAGTTFVIASDGLSATWDLTNYPGLLPRSPQLLAGILLRDYGRNSDDATVLVYR